MTIDIVGEDPVTQAIIERLLSELRPDIEIGSRLPARGGQIKSLAPNYNNLNSPIFLLTDLDSYACPPTLLADWFKGSPISDQMLIRIAQDEAETWLMADRKGFSKWLSVDIDLIPEPDWVDKRKNIIELKFPYKPSLYMMMNIASNSTNPELRNNLTPKVGAKKGPAYNATLLEFIQKKWNIHNAAKNSYSLTKAIKRVTKFNPVTI